jgi:ankyrin repeat protein
VSNPYTVDLSPRPDLAQQRKRAKDLLKALHAGDANALARVRYSHPRLAAAAPDAIRSNAKLADAQWVIAREYGFASWPRLKQHIEALNGGPKDRRHAFEPDLQYYRDRAAGMLSVFATGERNALRLVQTWHPAYAVAGEADIRAAALTQEDAELILAREHGFASFAELADHVAALKQKRTPFAAAFDAIKADDRAALAAVLKANPGLVNAAGTNGNRMLMFAVSMGKADIAADLLAAGADPTLANNKGWTALHDAAYTGYGDADERLATLDRLLAAGAAPETEAYGDGGTPLAVALFWGHTAQAERLAAIAVTPHNLRVAAALGRLDLMASFFAPDGSLRPEAGDHREFHRPHSGFPPWRPTDDPAEILAEALGYAARSGRIEAMAFLLERGVAIDAEPYNGTALHWAVGRQRLDATAWLIDHGADVNRRAAFGGTRGVTPLHVAAAWGGSPACARLLMERGADATLHDDLQGSTPLGWARHFNNMAIREDILEIGSRRDIFVAVLARRPDRITALLDREPGLIGARDCDGRTPLEVARAEGTPEMVALLEART